MINDKVYLSNNGRNIEETYNDKTIDYTGPKNLIKFDKINHINNGVIYVDMKTVRFTRKKII